MKKYEILLVEDEESYAIRFKKNLELEDFEVKIAKDGEEAIKILKEQYFDIIITDLKMPKMDGIELIRKIRAGENENIDADIPIVVLTSVNTIDAAVESMKVGASDFITKESEKKEILMRIRKVLKQSQILNENRYLRDQLARQDEFKEIIGESQAIKDIKREIQEISNKNVIVLLTGETGSGKELVARAIHRSGFTKDGPFIDVNCGALPTDNLFQSDVFGHEKGAFTDAKTQSKGKFEIAEGGTLFLDEISELSFDSQKKILRVFETSTIYRLGGSRPIKINCRIICATNRNLQNLVKEGKFREDLYYRINVYPITISPLRDRKEDIPLLVRFFTTQLAKTYSKKTMEIEKDAMDLLKNYPWYGNVRELKNIIERLVIRARNNLITKNDIIRCGIPEEKDLQPVGNAYMRSFPLEIDIPEEGINLEEVEKSLVIEALKKSNWSQKDAAKLLGISIDRMNSRIKKFGLKHPSWRVHK